MVEKECSSLVSSVTSKMDIEQQDKQDVSKVFAYLRHKLNAKEKELLELQRGEPCLLAPDAKQIETLLDVISSLHLSTQDGSFIFASTSKSNSCSYSSTSVCSTGVDSIKTLPSTVWLSESKSIKPEKEPQNEYRLPMVTHLLSLPVNAYVASSSNHAPLPSLDTTDQPSNRLPMVNELLSMPINAFKSSANNKSTPVIIEEKKESQENNNNNNTNQITSRTEPPKSILNTEKTYSKEHWLRKPSSESEEFVPLDLDTYIEQTSEKMRRLHTEYLQALEKLKSPSNPVDPSEAIKTIYPAMFDRIKQDISPKALTPPIRSKK